MSFRSILSVVVVVALGGFLLWVVNAVVFDESCCGQDDEDSVGSVLVEGEGIESVSIGGTAFNVEVRTTPAERAEGLSSHDSLEDGTGMLFIFPEPGQYSFWMKDMDFAIDIIWISDEKRIVHIEENVTPESYPKSFTSNNPAQYVLEINSGSVARQGIEVGDLVEF